MERGRGGSVLDINCKDICEQEAREKPLCMDCKLSLKLPSLSRGGQRNLEWRSKVKLGKGGKKGVVSVFLRCWRNVLPLFPTFWIFFSPWQQLVSNSLPLSQPMSMLILFALLIPYPTAEGIYCLSKHLNLSVQVKINPQNRIVLLPILRILFLEMRFELWSTGWAPTLTQHKKPVHVPFRSYNKA